MNIETLVINVCLLLQYSQEKSYWEDLTAGTFTLPIIHAITSHPDDSQVMGILLFQNNSFSHTSKTVYSSSHYIKENFTMLPTCINFDNLGRITNPLLFFIFVSKLLFLHFDMILKTRSERFSPFIAFLLLYIFFNTLLISPYHIYSFHFLAS
jgi:hypothetical protein